MLTVDGRLKPFPYQRSPLRFHHVLPGVLPAQTQGGAHRLFILLPCDIRPWDSGHFTQVLQRVPFDRAAFADDLGTVWRNSRGNREYITNAINERR